MKKRKSNRSKIAEAAKKFLDKQANDFSYFLEKAYAIATGKRDYIHAGYLELLAAYGELIKQGKHKRLIVNAPPRSLKSFTLSVALVAYILGHHPETRIICVSYNQELADIFGAACLKIMQSTWYKKLFPNTRISKHNRSKNNFHTTQGGYRFATSIGGTLTGMGADKIFIDDPIKASEGWSEQSLKTVNEWFSNALVTRLDDPLEGSITVVMQRLHENDLTGYLLAQNEEIEGDEK